MRHTLLLHPDSRCDAVTSITVDATRMRDGELALEYDVVGTIGGVRLPSGEPGRGDRLWQHTCFEAFVGPGSGAAYYEFNASPSRQWAAYGFSNYREGMTPIESEPVSMDTEQARAGFVLRTAFPLDRLAGVRQASWRVGLSAVIEETNGRMSYWALTHPPGKPDFHHPDCFALELPPPSQR
jgi:hypothetical protein